jgi:hypothetical protein
LKVAALARLWEGRALPHAQALLLFWILTAALFLIMGFYPAGFWFAVVAFSMVFLFLCAFVAENCCLSLRIRELEKEIAEAPLVENDDVFEDLRLRTPTLRGNVIVVDNVIDPRALEIEIEDKCCEDQFALRARRARIAELIMDDSELSWDSKKAAIRLFPGVRRILVPFALRIVICAGSCLGSGIAFLHYDFGDEAAGIFLGGGAVFLLAGGYLIGDACRNVRRTEKKLNDRPRHAIGTASLPANPIN